MNDIEQKALAIKRKAWELVEHQDSGDELFAELHRLERHSPDLFEQIVAQMEADNGRWSESSGLPNVRIKREQGKVEEIQFETTGGAAQVLTWRSDFGERSWLEDFAKQIKGSKDAGPNAQ